MPSAALRCFLASGPHVPDALFRRKATDITVGAAGGVLSPLLWLLHFNAIHSPLESLRAPEPSVFGEAICLDLVYADDVACVLANRGPPRLVAASSRNAQFVRLAPWGLGLPPSAFGSFNFVVSRGPFAGSHFSQKLARSEGPIWTGPDRMRSRVASRT